MDVPELRKAFEERGIQKVKIGGFDVDGLLRGKYVSLEKFWSAAQSGFGFCDVIFGWDIADQLYDNATVTGWHSGYPDAHAKLDLSTFRVLPYEPDTACFLADFYLPDQKHPHPACPRNLLQARGRPRRGQRLHAEVRLRVRVLPLPGRRRSRCTASASARSTR
ncbi:MAG: hypothetical protein M5U28_04255 [Sandaracinaceae bacterium]|nr:hypothetical protein [Sandaracinaceae bacterium]